MEPIRYLWSEKKYNIRNFCVPHFQIVKALGFQFYNSKFVDT